MQISSVKPINYTPFNGISQPRFDENSIILQRAENKRFRAEQIRQEAYKITSSYSNLKHSGYSLSLDLMQEYFDVRKLKRDYEGAPFRYNNKKNETEMNFLKVLDVPRATKMVETKNSKVVRETTFLNDDFDTIFVWETNADDNSRNFYAFSNGSLTKYATGIEKNKDHVLIKKEYSFNGALISKYRENVREYIDGKVQSDRAFIAEHGMVQNYIEDEVEMPNGEISIAKIYEFSNNGTLARYYQDYNLDMPKFYGANKVFEFQSGRLTNYKYNFLNLDKELSADEAYIYRNGKFAKFYKDLKIRENDALSYETCLAVKNGGLSEVK